MSDKLSIENRVRWKQVVAVLRNPANEIRKLSCSRIWSSVEQEYTSISSSLSSFSTCSHRLSTLPCPLSSILLPPSRKVVRLAAVLLLSAFTLSHAPSNSRGATVTIEGVSKVLDAGGADLAEGVLVQVGTFVTVTVTGSSEATLVAQATAKSDDTIRGYFTTDVATTRTNLQSNFSVFGSFAFNSSTFFSDDGTTIELDYNQTDSPKTTQATFGDQDVYLMIFNNAVAGQAMQVGLFRGTIANPKRFYSQNDLGLALAFDVGFIDTFFGTSSESPPPDGSFQLGQMRSVGITSALTAVATRDNAFGYQISANTAPTSYSATGLPAGLNVDTDTGVIFGTPTANVGEYDSTIRAFGNSDTVQATLKITVVEPSPDAPTISSSAVSQTATAGVAYAGYTIVANKSPTSFEAIGLPKGLTVNTTTGDISGTPTATGPFTVTIFASNAFGTGSKQFTLTVAAPILTFVEKTFNALEAGITGAPTPTTGFVPIKYTKSSGDLPTGLTLNENTGVISGTPTVPGAVTLVIRGENAAGVIAVGSIKLKVNTGLATINSPATLSATAGNSLISGPGDYRITTVPSASVDTPTSFKIVSGSLPSGLTLDTNTGVISGIPLVYGEFTVGLAANNKNTTNGDNGGGDGPTFNLTITVELVAPAINSSLLGHSGTYLPYNYVLTADNLASSFSVQNAPSWISSITAEKDGNGLNIMRIAGRPTTEGRHEVTVSAINTSRLGAQQVDTKTLVINVYGSRPTASSVGVTPPGTGRVGVPFSAYLTGAPRDVNDPVYFNATGLPKGLAFGSAAARQQGLITGTPRQAGTFTIKVYIQNAKGYTTSTTKFTILP